MTTSTIDSSPSVDRLDTNEYLLNVCFAAEYLLKQLGPCQVAIALGSGLQPFIDKLENIKEVAGLIQRLVPDAKVGIGHGQMEGKQLEQLMLQFINGDFDVLVSTTIVESGLDVPNANTIFVMIFVLC